MIKLLHFSGVAMLALSVAACGGSGGSGEGKGANAPVAPTPTNGAQSDGSGGPTVPADNASFGALLNGVRANNGVSELTYDSRLASAAKMHSDDMADNKFFSHTGSDGSMVGDRATEAGYRWKIIGENLAHGPVGVDDQSVMDGFTNSPGHRANNLRREFEEFGLAKAVSSDRVEYWTVVFGTEQ